MTTHNWSLTESCIDKNWKLEYWNEKEWYYTKNNAKDTNYFTKFFTNYWYGEWLLVNENVILMMSLYENQ